MMKRTVAGCMLLCACLLFGASVWEGSAVVAGGGELPETGYYVSTNSFPRNTIVDVKNLETDKTVRVIVAGGLNSPGLLVALSKEAAAAIGMNARGVGRVRVTMPADPIAFSRFTEGLDENPDPDRNPKAAIAAAGMEAPMVAVEPEAIPQEVPASESTQAGQVTEALAPEATIADQAPVLVSPATSEPEADEVAISEAGAVDEGVGKPDETQLSETTAPVDIPDDYVPPPALVETNGVAQDGTIVQAEPVEESVPEAEPEMATEIVKQTEEPVLVEEPSIAEAEVVPEPNTEVVGETAVLEDAGSATLSVLDRLPKTGAEDPMPVPDFEKSQAMEAGPLTQEPSADTVVISEAAESEAIRETTPVAEAGTAVENPIQELPAIAQTEPDLVEPSIENPATVEPAQISPSESLPPQSGSGTVELALEPAEERPPEASIEIPGEAIIEKPAGLVGESQPVLVPEATVSIDSNLIVEAIPPVTAPDLGQPTEPALPDALGFIEPIPALPEGKPAVAAVAPQVETIKTLPIMPETTAINEKSTSLFKAPLVEKLEKGKYYVQLGAFGKADSVVGVLNTIDVMFPATVQAGGSVEKPLYRVFVGPLNLGESGALLMRFKKSGYPDAFVKEGS